MADLPEPPLLTLDGAYEFKTDPGGEYLLVTSTDASYGGGLMSLDTKLELANGDFEWVPVNGAQDIDGTATKREYRFRAPDNRMRLTLTGSTAATIIVRITRLVDKVI